MQINGIGARTNAPRPIGNQSTAPGFGQMLAQAIEDVSQLEAAAQQGSMQLAAGEVTDFHQVTLMAEKAELALNLTLAVRNKVLDAYQEIMRMPV